jgi:hypothetical protein
MNQLIGSVGIRLLFGKFVLGQRMPKEAGPEYLVVEIREYFFLAVDRHGLSGNRPTRSGSQIVARRQQAS